MFSTIQVSQFFSNIFELSVKTKNLTNDIQKPIKNLFDNSIISKINLTIEQSDYFFAKKIEVENITIYDSKYESISNPVAFCYTTPFDGEFQIILYIKKNEELSESDKKELEFVCNLIYSCFERSYAYKSLKKAKDIDSITGVLNITGFKSIGKMITDRHLMPKFAVIFMNIINFSEINKKYSHDTGDLFLREYAQKISSFLGKDGSIARLGGDNFSILVKKSLLAKLLKFLQEIKISITINGEPLSEEISVRAGITEGNRNFPVFEAYLSCAQEAYKSAIESELDDFVFF